MQLLGHPDWDPEHPLQNTHRAEHPASFTLTDIAHIHVQQARGGRWYWIQGFEAATCSVNITVL